MAKAKFKRKTVKREAANEQTTFARLESGVPGMDTILRGGFLAGGTYLLLGSPGSGKTIFANQLGFHDIEKGDGRRAIFMTLLAENHGRMFGHLESLSFFDRSQLSERIQYVSGYNVLEKDGLDGLLKLLGALVTRHRPNVLFIDGVASVTELAGRPIDFKKFVHNLNSVMGMSGCTTFLLSSRQGDGTLPEYTMVDGILSLTFERTGMKTAREVEVTKFRGSPHHYGRHFFEIDSDGITVYPRFEETFGLGRVPKVDRNVRLKTGTPSLDRILGGGIVKGSVTSLLGPAGTGKTTLGMRFLEEGGRRGEQGLFLNLYEHPDRLADKMSAIGSDVGKYFANGKIRILGIKGVETIIDKILYRLMQEMKESGAKRIFIDGLSALKQQGVLGSDRLEETIKALASETRCLGATMVLVEETDSGTGNEHPVSFNSAIADNIIELNHAVLDSERTLTLNILKTRESDFDSCFFELKYGSGGPEVGQPVRFIRPKLASVEYAKRKRR